MFRNFDRMVSQVNAGRTYRCKRELSIAIRPHWLLTAVWKWWTDYFPLPEEVLYLMEVIFSRDF